MEEREQRAIALDAQRSRPPLAGGEPVRLETCGLRRQRAQQRLTAAAEQRRVSVLVLGVAQVQAAQHAIRSELGRARQIASAVRLRLGEAEQLAGAPVRI